MLNENEYVQLGSHSPASDSTSASPGRSVHGNSSFKMSRMDGLRAHHGSSPYHTAPPTYRRIDPTKLINQKPSSSTFNNAFVRRKGVSSVLSSLPLGTGRVLDHAEGARGTATTWRTASDGAPSTEL